MDFGLKEKVALVTGATGGIGKATALAFAREGARVAVTYRHRKAEALAVVDELEALGAVACAVEFSLGDEGSTRGAVAQVIDLLGGLHVLVNNAVASGPGGPPPRFEEISSADWRGGFATTAEGAFLMIQAALPALREQRWGRIINVSTNLTEDPFPGGAIYAASKAALHGLTRTLSRELGPYGILTNAVLPGLTATEKVSSLLPPPMLEQARRETFTYRLSRPEDVANAIVFLGSAANGNVNGELIRVTGGCAPPLVGSEHAQLRPVTQALSPKP